MDDDMQVDALKMVLQKVGHTPRLTQVQRWARNAQLVWVDAIRCDLCGYVRVWNTMPDEIHLAPCMVVPNMAQEEAA